MDQLPPDEYEEEKREKDEAIARERSRLNNLVAITVAILASFIAVCKVRDYNINSAMQEILIERANHWASYQAHHNLQHGARFAATNLTLQAQFLPPGPGAAFLKQAAEYHKLDVIEGRNMALGMKQSEGLKRLYNDLNLHDAQFDIEEAALSIAIALLALAALTHKRWLYGFAMIPSLFGIFMGIAGFLRVALHPGLLMRVIGGE